MKATKTKKFYINFIDGKMLLCAENKKLEITEIEGSVTEITEKMSPYGQEQIEIIIKNEQIEYHIVGYKQNNAIIALINFLSTAENLTKIKITSYEKQAKNLNKIRTYGIH